MGGARRLSARRPPARSLFRSLIDGESADATVTYGNDGMKVAIDGTAPATDARVFVADDEVYVLRHGRQTRVRLQDFSAARRKRAAAMASIKAPMHGRVLELFVGAGDQVDGRSAPCRYRGDEDGTHACARRLPALCEKLRSPPARKLWKARKIMLIEPAAERINRSRMPLHLIKLCVGCELGQRS